jgi:hypothetical protein
MKRIVLIVALACGWASAWAAPPSSVPFDLEPAPAPEPSFPINPAVDMDGFLQVAKEAAKHREKRRLTEDEFIRMSRLPGIVILDARSRDVYEDLHVKGAMQLSLPDIAIAMLDSLLPDRNTPILIYCDNNFIGDELSLARRLPVASLNLFTYIALYSYGYRDIWELGPTIDITKSKIEFESTWWPPVPRAAR